MTNHSSIVILIGYDRPEFLSICCDQVLKADNHKNYRYLFALDYGFHPDNLKVISDFSKALDVEVNYIQDEAVYSMTRYKQLLYKVFPNLGFTGKLPSFDIQKLSNAKVIISKTPKQYGLNPKMKQSFHVLNAYLRAAKLTDKLIFMIEDDIMIGKDFFTFHEGIHGQSEVFCSTAVINNNSTHYQGNENQYYISKMTAEYQSWGVCFKKSMIEQYITPYCLKEYFQTPQCFFKFHFPTSKIDVFKIIEQDGLVTRIKEKYSLKAAFPCIPRAFHSGYYGYHRGKNPYKNLSFLQKKKEVENVIFDVERLDNVQVRYKDSVPCNLNTSHRAVSLLSL